MALVTYPLNNLDYSAEDAELFHCTRSSGIYANDDFAYSVTGADNTVVLGPGLGWIRNSKFSGKVVALKSALALDFGIPDSTYPRIDAAVIQFDANKNQTEAVVKHGTAGSVPTEPEVIKTETLYELHLCHVRREVGATSITVSDITDLRLNPNYCGLMADSVTEIDTAAINDQVSALIQSLRDEISGVKDGSEYLFKTGGTMSGPIDMGGCKITNLAPPADDADAATKAYADTKVAKREQTVTLSPSGWASLSQSVAVEGVTADNTVLVTPAPESYAACLEAGAYCSGQGAGTLSFGCIQAPGGDITFNVLILEEGGRS